MEYDKIWDMYSEALLNSVKGETVDLTKLRMGISAVVAALRTAYDKGLVECMDGIQTSEEVLELTDERTKRLNFELVTRFFPMAIGKQNEYNTLNKFGGN